MNGLRVTWVMLAALAVSGCGTTVVDYRVELDVSPPGEVTYIDRPKTKTPFPSAVFTGELLRVEVGVSSLMFRFIIDNRSTEPVVLDWSRATIATNYQPDPVALTARHIAISGEVSTYGRRVAPGVVERQTISGGGQDFASFQPHFAELFPSGLLFNRTMSNHREVRDAGIGNWVVLNVPVLVAGDETRYSIRFTSRDAKARVSYH